MAVFTDGRGFSRAAKTVTVVEWRRRVTGSIEHMPTNTKNGQIKAPENESARTGNEMRVRAA
ncbi:hypothetical protein [Actimicrobium antarcticum]